MINSDLTSVNYIGYSTNIVRLNEYTTDCEGYTFPSNGVIRVHIEWATGAYARAWITLNENTTETTLIAVSNPVTIASASSKTCIFPVFKGQTVRVSTSAVTNGGEVVTFIPYLQAQ